MNRPARTSLAETIYARLKEDIFEFRLLPGERFTETEVATRMAASRTPVREALYRLEREGHIEVSSRNGWNVRALDFALYDHLYDVRVVLELAAVERLCRLDPPPDLDDLQAIWLVPEQDRLAAPQQVARLDEAFHLRLVAATGNPEMARIFNEVTERIRIIRRLDFTQPERVRQTYEEHAAVLRQILAHRVDQAQRLLKSHIEISKAEVKKITLHRLHQARTGQN